MGCTWIALNRSQMLFDEPSCLDAADTAKLASGSVDPIDDGILRYLLYPRDFLGGAKIQHVPKCRDFQCGQPLDGAVVAAHAFSSAHCSGCWCACAQSITWLTFVSATSSVNMPQTPTPR